MSTQTQTEFQRIPLDQIVPSKSNPRGIFEETALKELAQSIKEKGVIQPITVRAGSKKEQFEIVTGERRWRASKLAGAPDIPAMVMKFTDQEALEVQVIENLQRADIHFLDEAKGYKQLLEMDKTLSPELLADKVGKPMQYIHSRLSLNKLQPELHALAYEDKMSLGIATRIARLDAGIQQEVKKFIADPQRQWVKKKKGGKIEINRITSAEIDEFLQLNVYVDLKRAPFDITDAKLVAKAGPCTTCPKRTGASPLLFKEFADRKQPDICTDTICFHTKADALVNITKAKFPKAVLIAEETTWHQKLPKNIIRKSEYGSEGWRQSAAGACEFTTDAIVVAGKINHRGEHRLVCAAEKCPVHSGRSGTAPKPKKQLGVISQEALKQQEELWKRRTAHATRLALHKAIHAKTGKPPIEALRFAVSEATLHAQVRSDGTKHLREVWGIPDKDAGQDEKKWGRWRQPWDVWIEKASEVELLRFLVDLPLGNDVAEKISSGEKIHYLAGVYEIPKGVAQAVKTEWDAKKKASYAKRDARLTAENKKLERQKNPKPVKAALAEAKAKTGPACRYCGCTENAACQTDQGPCSWIEEPKRTGKTWKPGVCSAKSCVLSLAKDKKAEKKGARP